MLDLMHLRGKGPESGEDSENAALLQKHDDALKAAHLARLKGSGRSVIGIPSAELAHDTEQQRWLFIDPWSRR